MFKFLQEYQDKVVIGVSCLLIVVMISLIGLKLQNMTASQSVYRNYSTPSTPKNNQPIPNHHSLVDIKGYLEPWIAEKINHLEKRVDVLDHRTWLLAVVNNENAVISKKLAGDSGYANKYVLFDSAWKLTKTPEFLKISAEDYKKLSKSIATQNKKSQPKIYYHCN